MNREIKVIVSGAAGRMGKAIIDLIPSYKNIVLTGALEKEAHPLIGEDINTVSSGVKGVRIIAQLAEIVKDTDVLIEFSIPQATLDHMEIISSYSNKAMVIGTTGFTVKEEEKIKEFSKNIACLKAPNMSTGMNLLFNIVGRIAKVLGEDYDAEIVEAHHNRKVDAPSGTAKRLAEEIASAYDKDLEKIAIFGRKGKAGPRVKGEIGIHAVRAGGIVGEHRTIFAGGGEQIEIIHRAESRDAFAHGALRATQWIAGKKPGLYRMNDILGL
ncbi:MAG TPA: 4-hydroxy-tetrahydrodipicolinate reductase [Candidatus Omnitrophica bacterium]|nr:4-hydroxy-tetrahydrodipicolinate reductase [Candidatus Omnitrophota bacterium]